MIQAIISKLNKTGSMYKSQIKTGSKIQDWKQRKSLMTGINKLRKLKYCPIYISKTFYESKLQNHAFQLDCRQLQHNKL